MTSWLALLPRFGRRITRRWFSGFPSCLLLMTLLVGLLPPPDAAARATTSGQAGLSLTASITAPVDRPAAPDLTGALHCSPAAGGALAGIDVSSADFVDPGQYQDFDVVVEIHDTLGDIEFRVFDHGRAELWVDQVRIEPVTMTDAVESECIR